MAKKSEAKSENRSSDQIEDVLVVLDDRPGFEVKLKNKNAGDLPVNLDSKDHKGQRETLYIGSGRQWTPVTAEQINCKEIQRLVAKDYLLVRKKR